VNCRHLKSYNAEIHHFGDSIEALLLLGKEQQMLFMRRGSGECLVAAEEEARKPRRLTSAAQGGLTSTRGLEGQPAPPVSVGEGMCRCVYMEVRVPVVACIFAMCGACGVLREQ